jgi:hypothetical protein
LICRDMFRKIGNKAKDIAENNWTARTVLFRDRPLSTSRDGRLPRPLVTLRRRAPGRRFDEYGVTAQCPLERPNDRH